MATGWIRAYAEENAELKSKFPFFKREERAEFRSKFSTPMMKTRSQNGEKLAKLKWGDVVDLPNGLSKAEWTKVEARGKSGFVRTKHLVEIAFVKRGNGSSKHNFEVELDFDRFDWDSRTTKPAKKKLLWGDLVQIISRGPKRSEVWARGRLGKMDTADLEGGEALLEVYFVDVGQGDGVYVRTPDFKHMLIDGGLERTKQQTGKNAADFVDWKYFYDYGDYKIRLDSMMASHSDTDHFGGLHDLIRNGELSDRELDCVGVDIKKFHHPGLSRWTKVKNANPPHADGLGPKLNKGFVRLLDDREDAESTFKPGAKEKLSFPWSAFIKDILANSKKTKFERVMVSKDDVAKKPLPNLWPKSAGCAVKILSPVSYKEQGGKTALLDLGNKGKNTNGHSICLRLDYGKARILLTGDLNTKSMHWLEDCYDDRISAFKCDVAKACHHGSDDISYRFLEAINAAATIISSGDAEGHAHPRPEIVGASATSGHKFVDRDKDRLVTPLVYMTEIERSVTLGSINRIDVKGLQTEAGPAVGSLPGRPLDEINEKGFLSPADRKQLKGKSKEEANKIIGLAKAQAESNFEPIEEQAIDGDVRVDVNLTVPLGPVDKKNASKRLWRARLMQKNHYGLVNVRTDGKTIMCATLNETEKKWIIHTFLARFPDS